MICVWEQTHGPCMFLLTLLQILGQIKDATWLLQTKCSDRADFVFLTSSTSTSFPVLSPLFASFPQITTLSTFSCPHFHHVPLQSFFLFQTYPLPSLYPMFPISLSHFHHMSERLGFVWFLPYSGSGPAQAPLGRLSVRLAEQAGAHC